MSLTPDNTPDWKADSAWHSGNAGFPNVFCPVRTRNKAFYKAAIDYAIKRFIERIPQISHITKLKASYNGLASRKAVNAFNRVDGIRVDHKAKFTDFRLSSISVNQLTGEFVESPLHSTISTINATSVSHKKKIANIHKGLEIAKPQLQKMQEMGTVMPFDGMQANGSQENMESSSFSKMRPRTKNEFVMQTIANRHVKVNHIKDKFVGNLKDGLQAAECFGKVDMDSLGNVSYRNIDPRRALYEYVESDPFMERSPYLGEVRPMYLHEILEETPELKHNKNLIEKIRRMEADQSELPEADINKHHFQRDSNGNLLIFTYNIEFFTYTPTYFKEYNYKGKNRTGEMNIEAFEDPKNNKRIMRDVAKGKYKVYTRYKKSVSSATRIGSDIYVKCGVVPYNIGSWDNEYETELNYGGCVVGDEDGVHISIFESMEEVKHQYNVGRWMMNRELGKAKGNVMSYDRQYLPKVKGRTLTMAEVIYKMVNDGIIDNEVAGEGMRDPEMWKKDIHLQVRDLGLSRMFPTLIEMCRDLERLADSISGINKERKGLGAASATATGTENNLQQSRSMTAYFMYFMNRFFEKQLRKIIEREKIAIAYIPEARRRAETYLGQESVSFLVNDKEIAREDYSASINDGRHEQAIRDTVRKYIEQASASGSIMPEDAIAVEMSETLSEMRSVLAKGWEKMAEVNRQAQKDKNEGQMESIQAKTEADQAKIEDMQQHEAAMEVLKGLVKSGVVSQEAMNTYMLNAQGGQMAMEQQQQQQQQEQQVVA